MLDGTDHFAQARGQAPHLSFAASHRAIAACAREITSIEDAVIAHANGWYLRDGTGKPVVSRSPGRCIVQLGPVALTTAWLRHGAGTVADGELLVVVWRGQVGARVTTDFARMTGPAPARSATALWEAVFVVAAESEAAWEWSTDGLPNETSTAVANRIAEHLQAARQSAA